MKSCVSIVIITLAVYIAAPARAVKIGLMIPANEELVRKVYDGVMMPYNGSSASNAEFKLGTFYGNVINDDMFSTATELCEQLRHQVTAVVLSCLTHTSKSLQSLFRNTNVPYLSTSYQDHCRVDLNTESSEGSANGDRRGISLLPDLIPAIADTIDNFQWNSLLFVYDSDAGTQKWQRLLAYKYKHTSVNMRYAKRIVKTGEANEFLKSVDSADRDSTKYVILDVPFEKAKEIIVRHVRDPHVGRRNFHFLLSHPVVNEISHQHIPEFQVVNVTAFKLTGESEVFRNFFNKLGQANNIARYADVQEEKINLEQALIHDAAALIVQTYKDLKFNSVLKANQHDIFDAFLRIDNPPTESATCSIDKMNVDAGVGDAISITMKKLSIQGFSGKLEFTHDGCRKNFVVDIVRVARDGKLTQFAQWEYGKGYVAIPERVEREKETKVNHQRTYIISTLINEPFLFENEQSQWDIGNAKQKTSPRDLNSKFHGYLKDLADELAKLLQIKYEFRVTKDEELGKKSGNSLGGWTGVVGEVVREEADFGLVSNPSDLNLKEVVEFSQPFMFTGISAIASKGSITPDCLQVLITFLRPFGWPLWICIASSFGVVFLFMFIVSICVARADCKKGIEHSFCDDVYNSAVFTVDAFLPHYIDSYYARSIAGRVISNFWWIFILLVFSAYTAQLVPILKSDRATLLNPSLTNISQLANQHTISYGFARGSLAESYFHGLRTNDSNLEKIANTMRRQSNEDRIETEQEGIDKVKNANETFVFFLDSNKADFINSRSPCDTFKVQHQPLSIRGVAAILPKNSYLKQEIDSAITILRERGSLDKLYDKWWNQKSNCTGRYRSTPVIGENVHLYNFIGVLAIPAGGIAIGFVLAFFEICYRACTRGRRIRQIKKQQLSQQEGGACQGAEAGFSNITPKDEELNLQPQYPSP